MRRYRDAPVVTNRTVPITMSVVVEPAMWQRIDAYAKYIKIPRSAAMRELLGFGLDMLE